MDLHHNKVVFEEITEAAAVEFNLQPFQVEKDYYVSLFLKKLREVAPNIVFKGGTSLSKCYQVINRFSEDIDLAINFEGDKLSSGPLKRTQESLIQSIRETIESLNFILLNDEQHEPIRAKRNFNQYRVGYSRIYNDEEDIHMLDHILVETILAFKPFPCEMKSVSNYITRFLEEESQTNIIEDYSLQPFIMNIQSIDRTFVDKLFAVCDYHQDEDYIGKSRHLYDIHMIYQSGLLNTKKLPHLVAQIIEDRRKGKKTYSCQAGYRPLNVLDEIINDAVFKKDYETNTKEFLSEYEDYGTVIQSLQEIIYRGWMPKEIPEDPQNLILSDNSPAR